MSYATVCPLLDFFGFGVIPGYDQVDFFLEYKKIQVFFWRKELKITSMVLSGSCWLCSVMTLGGVQGNISSSGSTASKRRKHLTVVLSLGPANSFVDFLTIEERIEHK